MTRPKRKSHEMITLQRKRKRKQLKEEANTKNGRELGVNQYDEIGESSSTIYNKLINNSEDNMYEQVKRLTNVSKQTERVRRYRQNMSEEKKEELRAIARRKLALKRANMSEEEKATIRAENRLRNSLKRQNLSEEKKEELRAIARRKIALKRKSMSEEKKAAMREENRLRKSLKRKNMSEEEKAAEREYHRQRMAMKRENMTDEEKQAFREDQRKRMALKRQNMSEEEKLLRREIDRHRMAMKRKVFKDETEGFQTSVVRFRRERQRFPPKSVDLEDSSDDNGTSEDIQRFLAITLKTELHSANSTSS
ncbi:trichohyalin-like isoform X2 [Macrosteles quadrilineatus]|uniref:trichohyalin-like isoform X2 n=1 Tax=Macrosteles quadrilineatus TaxID=74068 RepID=UPI0023E0C8F0|nr:trichohyalin-like isoform X2 [Macrosteles quadrilineatus]